MLETILQRCGCSHAICLNDIAENDKNAAMDYEVEFSNKHTMITSFHALLGYYGTHNYYYHYLVPKVGIFTQHFIEKPRYSFIPFNAHMLPSLWHEPLLQELAKDSHKPFKIWGLTAQEMFDISFWRKGKYVATKHTEALYDSEELVGLRGKEYTDVRNYLNRWNLSESSESKVLSKVHDDQIFSLFADWKADKSFKTDNYKEFGMTKRVPLASGMYYACISRYRKGARGIAFANFYKGVLVSVAQGFIDMYERAYLTTTISHSRNKDVARMHLGIIMPLQFAQLCRVLGVKKFNYGDISKMEHFIQQTKMKLHPQVQVVYTLEMSKKALETR